MLRGLPSWIAAVLLLVATGTLPWTWGHGTAFSRAFEANGGMAFVWWQTAPLDGASVAFVLIAVGFVVRIPRWAVAGLAVAGAVACLAEPDRGALGGVLLTFVALALGVAAAFAPRPTTRPRLVPVLAGAVLLAVALTPTAITIGALSDDVLIELLEWMLFAPWAATVLLGAAAAVALTPSLPGGRLRALIPVVAGAAIAAAVLLAEDVTLAWNGLPVAGLALAAAAIALVRTPKTA